MRCVLLAMLLSGCMAAPPPPPALDVQSRSLDLVAQSGPEVLLRGLYTAHGGWDVMTLPGYARRLNVYPMGAAGDTLWIMAEETYDGVSMSAVSIEPVGLPYTLEISGYRTAQVRGTAGSRWKMEVTR